MIHNVRNSISTVAKAARTALGITQEKVSETVGISTEFYSRLERGQATPSVRVLIALSMTLRTTPNRLLGFDDDPSANPSLAQAGGRGGGGDDGSGGGDGGVSGKPKPRRRRRKK